MGRVDVLNVLIGTFLFKCGPFREKATDAIRAEALSSQQVPRRICLPLVVAFKVMNVDLCLAIWARLNRRTLTVPTAFVPVITTFTIEVPVPRAPVHLMLHCHLHQPLNRRLVHSLQRSPIRAQASLNTTSKTVRGNQIMAQNIRRPLHLGGDKLQASVQFSFRTFK